MGLWRSLYATDYIYPVMEANEQVYLLHQHQNGLDLLEWNAATKQVSHALASWYTPTNVTLLPGKHAFSFIDSDTIKVKAFNQRSPYTIPLDMPLYNFTIIQWIDDAHCYCSATKQGVFGIYEISYDGEVTQKVFDKSIDCMYPQKLGAYLYYITRALKEGVYYYSIRRCMYTSTSHSPEDDELYIDCGTMPIAFLSRIPVEGIGVLSYEIKEANDLQGTVLFRYFCVSKEKKLEECFSFYISKKLLFGDQLDRLYESLLPLLPRLRGDNVYFVSSDGMYYFDLIKKEVVCCNNVSYCFVPLLSGFYGGSLSNNMVIPYIKYDSYDSLQLCQIPSIDL